MFDRFQHTPMHNFNNLLSSWLKINIKIDVINITWNNDMLRTFLKLAIPSLSFFVEYAQLIETFQLFFAIEKVQHKF